MEVNHGTTSIGHDTEGRYVHVAQYTPYFRQKGIVGVSSMERGLFILGPRLTSQSRLASGIW